MAKKIDKLATATLMLNPEKGGGWLATFHIHTEGTITTQEMSAWKNASAGKRWIKAKVQELTPRKSVKMTAFTFDPSDKATGFRGELLYKE